MLVAVPLGILPFAMGITTMIFRKGSKDSDGVVLPFLLIIIIYIVFTVNVSWEHTSGFWGTVFSTDIFLLILNALVALPGFFFWLINEP